MELIRTTLRLRNQLKKQAERQALDENTTLQNLFSRALEAYLKKAAKRSAKKIVFKAYDVGQPLDNLTRNDYYDSTSL